jgi:hypothetical protein
MKIDDTHRGLIFDLVEAGIIQFGLFSDSAPIHFNLELIPAYPDILLKLGDIGEQRLQSRKVDRLVTTPESLPAGISISLKSGISIAYQDTDSEGSNGRIIGAYDTGHVTALIINCWLGADAQHSAITAVLDHCARVGLDVVHIMSVLGINSPRVDFSGTFENLISIPEMIATLEQSDHIPAGQAAAVTNWLDSQR